MLSYNSIDERTLDILRRLQAASQLAGMRLVGGTALALQFGHRKSVDLDLFGNLAADHIELSRLLSDIGKMAIISQSQNIHIYSVDGVKVDIVNYPYQWLEEPVSIDGLNLAGTKDIAAMKLAAVTNRGSRKDFIDIFFLLNRYSLAEILALYQDKYPDGSPFLVLKSLSYFDDADEDEPPMMLIAADWMTVKETIRRALGEYIKQQNYPA